jgi:phytoene dehydrogenase-like protein
MNKKITIIGAGVAGLSAAIYLHRKGYTVQILEASDRAGGRIKTDIVDGFRLDHGFQVLLTAYPEAKALLDYEALKLKRFLPGATVLYDGGQFDIADPFRRPSATFSTLFAPVGNLKDKINTLSLKIRLLKKSISEIFNQTQTTTRIHLSNYGFSNKMIDRFYGPFFSGIFLENNLETSNRMFDFVMKMFSEGDAAIPSLGMEEIPKQLIALLPANSIVYNTKVSKIEGNKVETEDGRMFMADKIVIATEASSGLAKQYLNVDQTQALTVTNIYFETPNAPSTKAIVILNASTNRKWVNNITVLTNLSKAYGPDDRSLISVSCNGLFELDDHTLAQNMKNELKPWFGDQVLSWKMIKSYRIKYGLPKLQDMNNETNSDRFKISDILYICGDHLLNGSINAAMGSGRMVADLIEKDFDGKM